MGDFEDIFGAGADIDAIIDGISGPDDDDRSERETATALKRRRCFFPNYVAAEDWERSHPGIGFVRRRKAGGFEVELDKDPGLNDSPFPRDYPVDTVEERDTVRVPFFPSDDPVFALAEQDADQPDLDILPKITTQRFAGNASAILENLGVLELSDDINHAAIYSLLSLVDTLGFRRTQTFPLRLTSAEFDAFLKWSLPYTAVALDLPPSGRQSSRRQGWVMGFSDHSALIGQVDPDHGGDVLVEPWIFHLRHGAGPRCFLCNLFDFRDDEIESEEDHARHLDFGDRKSHGTAAKPEDFGHDGPSVYGHAVATWCRLLAPLDAAFNGHVLPPALVHAVPKLELTKSAQVRKAIIEADLEMFSRAVKAEIGASEEIVARLYLGHSQRRADVCGLYAHTNTLGRSSFKTTTALKKRLVDWGPAGLDLIESALAENALAGVRRLSFGDRLLEHFDLRRTVTWGWRGMDWNYTGGGISFTAAARAGPLTAQDVVATATKRRALAAAAERLANTPPPVF